ncbi:DUF2577 domain-containing protein [Vallitalea guaymasensis]|uniref:DUF2577 domain-containing protein n=1 Tax=Vallitalea guaymasensis TaxID=1185412 RepID=A0A8J8MFT6_9FIRM|nr:DUF2577 domain-containing protein [Vallitalea guaymasensis]QUH32008.1 DUF2577 domain-containing protein [Vallitalea guaymasensis]
MSNTQKFIGALKQINQGVKDNSQDVTFYYGQVIEIHPLQIQVDQRFILDEDFLVLTSTVAVNNLLHIGDKVVLLRAQGGQQYIVLDKVVAT